VEVSDLQRIKAAWEGLGLPPGEFEYEPLPAQASLRRYVRVSSNQASWMAMLLPVSGGPEEIGGGDGPGPFLDVQGFLEGLELPVPRVYGHHSPSSVLVLEDLDDWTFERCLSQSPPFSAEASSWEDMEWAYLQAVDLLVEFQERTRGALELEGPWKGRGFDETLLMGEWEHFVEYLLCEGAGESRFLHDPLVRGAGERLVQSILKLPYGLTHRDYQSRNLMVTPRGLVMIDFQDALAGPYIYDLVALLRDSYILIPDSILFSLLRRYHESGVAAGLFSFSFEELQSHFDLVTLHRKAKDAGRFVFIDRVKGNPDFLKHIPDSVGYVIDALQRLPGFGDLGALLLPALRAYRESLVERRDV